MDQKLRNLLSNKNQLFLELIKYISDKDDWISVNEISAKLSVSTRTTQRYLKELRELINKFSKEKHVDINYEIKKKQGVRFYQNGKVSQLYLKSYIYQNDESIQLLLYLFFNKSLAKKKYCEINLLSESALANNLMKIRSFLSDFNLDLASSGLEILGKEAQIRGIAYSVSWVIFAADDWPSPFYPVTEESIEKNIDFLINDLNIPIHYIKKRELLFLVAIMIKRYRLGHPVICEDEWHDYFPKNQGSRLSEVVTKILINHQIVSKEEVVFFTINMLIRPCTYEAQPLGNELLSFIQKKSIVYAATYSFIENFSKKIALIPQCIYEDVFIFAFRSHLFAHIYNHMDFDYNSNYLLDGICRKIPSYKNRMTIFINQLFESTHATLFLESNYLTQRYFVIESFIKPRILLGKKLKIIVETDLPKLYESSIKKRIIDYFKYNYEIVFLDNQILQQADLILSTFVHTDSDRPVINFQYPLEEEELEKISADIEVVLQKR